MHSCRPQQGHFRRGSNHYSSPESFDDDPPAISFTERRHRNSPLGNGEQKCRNKNQSRPAILFSSMTSKPALRKAWFEAKFCVGEIGLNSTHAQLPAGKIRRQTQQLSVKTSSPIGWRNRKVDPRRIGI